MIGRSNGGVLECVVVDLNTQLDFCHPFGALPVANLAELIPNLRRVVAWTKRNGAPVISSVESHRPFEVPDPGEPLYCVEGSTGQRKIDFTLFPRCTQVEFDNTLSCPANLFDEYQQVIFPKRTLDLLDNPKAERFVTLVSAPEFIVYGVAVENSVKALALGLLARERTVSVVIDACGFWSKGTADLAIRQMLAKGVRIITLNELRTRKLDRRRRYLWLPRWQGESAADRSGIGRSGGNGPIRWNGPVKTNKPNEPKPRQGAA